MSVGFFRSPRTPRYPLQVADVVQVGIGGAGDAEAAAAAAAASANAAAASAAAAAASVNAAATNAGNSAASATQSSNYLAQLRNIYYGSYATPPTSRPDVTPLVPGDLFYHSIDPLGLYYYNGTAWQPSFAGGTGAGLLEAPSDGKVYGRKNLAWVEAATGTSFVTLAALIGTDVSATIKRVSTDSFAALGDLGGGNYLRRQTTPYPRWVTQFYFHRAAVQNVAGNFYYVSRLPLQTGGPTIISTIEPTALDFAEHVLADGFGWTRQNQAPQYPRSIDRNRYDGSLDSLHGGWWELQLSHNRSVYIEQLGGKNDHVPGSTTSTDHYDMLMAAINWVQFDAAQNSAAYASPNILFGFGRYRVSQTVILNNITGIRGLNIDRDAMGSGPVTQLWFTNTTGSAFCFLSNNTGPTEESGSWGAGQNTGTSTGSLLEGFGIFGTWDGVTPALRDDYTAAVRIRATMVCRNVGVFNWRSNGFHVHGAIGAGASYPYDGNCNLFGLIDCYVHSCGSWGLRIGGADCNAGYTVNFSTQGGGCKAVGLDDSSTLGNTHLQPHIAGYGDKGVTNVVGGVSRQYQYTNRGDDPRVVEPGVTPNWQNTWYHVNDGPSHPEVWPQWVPGVESDRLPKMPIFVFNPFTVIVGPYVEVNRTVSFSNSPHMIGGTASWTSDSAVFQSNRTSISFETKPSSPEYAALGPSVSASYGVPWNDSGVANFAQGFAILQFTSGLDDEVNWNVGYYNNDICFASPRGGIIMRFTTAHSTQTWGRGSIQERNRIMLSDYGFRDPVNDFSADGAPVRVHGMRINKPSGPGVYAKGETYAACETNKGTFTGWRCTTAGAIADSPWTANMVTSYTALHSNAGHVYRKTGYGVSTIAPTHLSGTVTYDQPVDPVNNPTGVDATWIYVSPNTPYEFSEYGPIAGAADTVPYTNASGNWSTVLLSSLTTREAVDALETRLAALEARL